MKNLIDSKCFLLFFYCCCFLTLKVYSQRVAINISDNIGTQYNSAAYRITTDSLIINGVSDDGRSHINYLSRKLKLNEKTELLKFMKSFPADSLKETYFNDYTNFEYISSDNFPRVLELEIEKGKHIYKSKSTNAYVTSYSRLFNYLNKMLPDEVKIKYDRNKFNAFY